MTEEEHQLIYEEIPTPETQPLQNPTRPTGRRYVGAVWSAPGEGGGHPKISGGYETDKKGNVITARGFNRVDQRYAQDASTLETKRQNRALLEINDTSLVAISAGRVGVRTITGNVYRVDLANLTCDCPDMFRLREDSAYDAIYCKHIYMAQIAVGTGTVDDLPWSCQRIAEETGAEPRTIAQHCLTGDITATKKNGVWQVDPAVAATWVAAYIANIIGREGVP